MTRTSLCRGLLLSLLFATVARGDYLIVRRDAAVKALPDSASLLVQDAKPPQALLLLQDEQANGYYRVRSADGVEGWVYRTFVRRYKGEPPNEDSSHGSNSGGSSTTWGSGDGSGTSASMHPSVGMASVPTRTLVSQPFSLRSTPAFTTAASAMIPAAQAALFAEHCGTQWGVPTKQTNFGQTYYVSHPGYVLEYNAARKLPLWVCHHVTVAQFKASFAAAYQRPPWREEDGVPEPVRVHDSDYPLGGKPYNRGHMAPNADFGTKDGRDGTFILSNAVPQQWQNNQQIWQTFEGYVRKWIEARGEAYVITGSLLYDPSDDPESEDYDADGHDGVVDYEVMGASEVTVPTHVFKVVIAPKAKGSNEWESIAVVLENRRYLKGADRSFDDDLDNGLRSIDWIEKRAGLDLLPALREGSADERAIESDSVKPTHLWSH